MKGLSFVEPIKDKVSLIALDLWRLAWYVRLSRLGGVTDITRLITRPSC